MPTVVCPNPACSKAFSLYPSACKRGCKYCSRKCYVLHKQALADPEKRRAYLRTWHRNYRIKYPERGKQSDHIYTVTHRTERRERNRTYRAKNRHKVRIYRRQYWAKRRETLLAYGRAYYRLHPDYALASGARRRARKAAAPRNDLSRAQWREIKAAYEYRCVYCGKKSQRLTQDHITPLSHGGAHTMHNILPACGSCNSKKHTGPPLVPVQPLLLTIAPSRKEKPA